MEINIKNIGVESAEKIKIDRPQWGYTEYVPNVYVQIAYNETGFDVKFTVEESNPLCEKTENFGNIHEDSCVEFFVKFDPENSDKYMNFEINAIGTVKAAIRTCREDFIFLSQEDIESLNIKTEILENSWTVSYHISAELLKKLYPKFNIKKCNYIMANFYKCGNNTDIKHYLSLFDLKCEKPDFHKPEYFGKINLI